MILLAIDTSTHLGSVAVVDGGRLLAEVSARVRARHGETLLPHVQHVLAQAGVSPGELGLIAAGLGPGSFTGLRVGVATAKGLALALGVPIIGVCTLRVLARGLGGHGTLAVPVVDAHKGEVFAAIYRTGDRLTEIVAPFHASPARAAAHLRPALQAGGPVLTCGDGARRYAAELATAFGEEAMAAEVFDAPRAALLAVEALQQMATHGPSDLRALEPMYVPPNDAALRGG